VNDEQMAKGQAAVTTMLQLIGENPGRDGLLNTPGRVVRALVEMTAGYAMDPEKILATTFAVAYDELVVLKDVHFVSLCEHHMLPFAGVAHIGYLPGERVVGLSKMARLVQCYAQRLQVQERMTRQIADAMQVHLKPLGVGVVVQASHSCMTCRGVRQESANMVTSAMLGRVRENESLRAEFLRLIGL
jgi:GTP cyclohydrolase I